MVATNLDRFRDEIKKLRDLAVIMQLDLGIDAGLESDLSAEQSKTVRGTFRRRYQHWYTSSREVVRQLIPARLDEFDEAYRADPRRKELVADTYKIQDWLLGLRANDYLGNERFSHASSAFARFSAQMGILEAAELRLESAVHDLVQLVQAELFDNEVDAASELLKKGFLRAAGAVCGVVLEKHLSTVASNHSLRIRKKAPTIADLNDSLKDAGVYDLPTWRNIQHLADIRNLCDHNKDREPTVGEVTELIAGTTKIGKTVF